MATATLPTAWTASGWTSPRWCPLGFWREYRRFVRSINPEAYLVGEVWWESWPDRIYDPAPWLQGDVFDAVMNYRWYMPTRSFFAGAPPGLGASGLRGEPRLTGDRDRPATTSRR